MSLAGTSYPCATSTIISAALTAPLWIRSATYESRSGSEPRKLWIATAVFARKYARMADAHRVICTGDAAASTWLRRSESEATNGLSDDTTAGVSTIRASSDNRKNMCFRGGPTAHLIALEVIVRPQPEQQVRRRQKSGPHRGVGHHTPGHVAGPHGNVPAPSALREQAVPGNPVDSGLIETLPVRIQSGPERAGQRWNLNIGRNGHVDS